MANTNYKSAYEILKHPFSNLRRQVADKFLSEKLLLDDFMKLSEALLEEAKQNNQISASDLSVEIKKAYHFLKKGETDETPDVSDSARQLIWGMALACSQSDPAVRKNWPSNLQTRPINKLKIWNEIKNSETARSELLRHAFMIRKMTFLPQEEKIDMGWGACNYPNVGFYFDKEHSRINLDLLWGLIGGFEHSRAMQLHEIGHSYGTLSFGKKMRALREEFEKLNEKARKRQITKEEYKRLREVEREHKFRFLIFDEAENSYANRFAANTSTVIRQDIGYDLNAVETQLFSVGSNLEKNKDGLAPVKDTVGNRAFNLKQAIRLSFFVNNGIVEDNPDEWRKLGVNIDWISYKTPEGEMVSGQEAFKKLRKMTSSLEDLQIKERDYYKEDEEVYKLALDYAEKRADIIDEIFDLYAMQYYEEAIKGKEKNNEEQKEDSQNNAEDKTQQNNSGNENSDDHSLDPEDSPEEENQGGMGDSESQNEEEQNEQDGTDGKDTGQDEQEDSENQGNENADGSDEEEKNWDDLSDEEKEHLKEDENGNIRKDELAELLSQMPEMDENMPPLEDMAESPEEVYKQKIAELMQDVEQDENEDFQNVMEIIRQAAEAKQQENEKENKKSFLSSSAPVPFEMPKTLMPENEYSKIVEKNYDMVEQLRIKFVDLQNEYYDETDNVEVRSIVPEAGNLRVDIPSYIERLKKQIKGEELKEADFENFIVSGVGKDQTKAPIDIAILIDDSGSMRSAGTNKLAMELGCALFQATRDNPAFNVYVALMHEPTTWIAKPGDNSIEISERLATIYHAGGWGDDKIGDNISAVLQEIEKRDAKDKREGLTNFFMITDGDHTDYDESLPMVDAIASQSVPITFNWVLTQDIDYSESKQVIERHKTGIGSQRIDYEDNVNHRNMLDKIMSLIEKRVEDAKQIEAMRTQDKQSDISMILETLGLREGGRNG